MPEPGKQCLGLRFSLEGAGVPRDPPPVQWLYCNVGPGRRASLTFLGSLIRPTSPLSWSPAVDRLEPPLRDSQSCRRGSASHAQRHPPDLQGLLRPGAARSYSVNRSLGLLYSSCAGWMAGLGQSMCAIPPCVPEGAWCLGRLPREDRGPRVKQGGVLSNGLTNPACVYLGQKPTEARGGLCTSARLWFALGKKKLLPWGCVAQH